MRSDDERIFFPEIAENTVVHLYKEGMKEYLSCNVSLYMHRLIIEVTRDYKLTVIL